MHFELIFGEQTLIVPQARVRQAREWRRQLSQELTGMMEAMAAGTQLELATVEDINVLVSQLLPMLLRAPDTILSLLLRYSGVLADAQEYIEEHATDEQVVNAFLTVLKAAYPLAPLMQLLGPEKRETSANSPPPRGRASMKPS